jgi:methyl-accepting chemotaxis protein
MPNSLTFAKRLGIKQSGWFSSIRIRLYLAFGFAAALTIIGSVIAYLEFVAIGSTTNRIVTRSLPGTVVSLRIAEEASSLVSSVPSLMAAADEKSRAEIAGHIDQQAKTLAQHLDRLKNLNSDHARALVEARDALLARLSALNQAVSDRIKISDKRNKLASSIRTAHEAMLLGLVPAIDDTNFDLMMMDKQAGMDTAVTTRLESLRRLLETQSETNHLAGLLTEASLVSEASRLEPLRDLVGSAKRKIETNLGKIVDPSLRKKLTGLYGKLAVVGADDGIITLRGNELARQEDAEQAFAAVQSEAAQLKSAVDGVVERQGSTARAVSMQASEQIRSGQIILIILSIVAILAAILVAWLYVGRSIARRLGLLSGAMRRIADGDLNVNLRDDRGDEIADMTRTLLFFRQATADAAGARQSEIDQARDSEVRRQRVEAATEKFEQTVANIVRTLDQAARAMDTSAREMADSATHNQSQALATAASSEQATTNVSIVATAAEEIARSIEHIATQVASTATVARKATDEAQAITGAVEGLSTSVGEIGEFSNLIRSIADQTNLLALNATIEAARAGDAGRGFAVVAQEVKGLATQAGKATEEITRKIASIEDTTSRSVQTMKTIAATILQLNELANDIAAAVRQQDSVTQEIARNADAAAKGTRDVSSNISEVSNNAVKTGQAAKTVLTAAGELAEQSDLLRQEVEHYLSQIRVA